MENLRRIGKGQVINLKDRNLEHLVCYSKHLLFFYLKKFNNVIELLVHKHSPPPKRNFNGWRVSQETVIDRQILSPRVWEIIVFLRE